MPQRPERSPEAAVEIRTVRGIEVDANDHAVGFYMAVGFTAGERVELDHGTAVRMVLRVDDR